MQTREQLEKRIADLEAQVAAAQSFAGRRGVRKRASWDLMGLPFYDIATGPEPAKREYRGHAKGFIAIGDFATGVIAIGGGALGGVAVGGGAVGYYACGGGAAGVHAASAVSQDPEAVAFFREHGMECAGRARSRYRY